LGWHSTPRELILKPDFEAIEKLTRQEFGEKRGAATTDIQQLKDLLDGPSQHIWVTFENGFMWWCTVRDGPTVNSKGQDGAVAGKDGKSRIGGNFWLTCDRPWSNKSLKGDLLATGDLPGSITKTKGFRGTVCQPDEWEAILRVIRGEKNPDVQTASTARYAYTDAVLKIVRELSWKDFEQLIDLILFRTGWVRIGTLGTDEGIDEEVKNLAVGEVAFVQIKSKADQHTLDSYVEQFRSGRERYARMIFAVHSQSGNLVPPKNSPEVQVWEGKRVSELVVQLGLGDWIEKRLR